MTGYRWLVVLLACVASCGERIPATSSRGEVISVSQQPALAFEPRCDSAPAPRPVRDSVPMCWVPAGEFTMGTPVDPARPEDGPARRVRISRGFYIDQYEVTNAQFVRYLRAIGRVLHTTPSGYLEGSYPVGPNGESQMLFDVGPGMERMPVTVVFAAAEAYCAWAGKRLPTEAEWEFAARHDPKSGVDRVYPWGDHYRPGVTNHFGSLDPTRGKYAAIGSFKDDRTAVGTYDMGGNASEWVADCFSLDFSCATPCVDPLRTTKCERVCSEGGSIVCDTALQSRGGSVTHDPQWMAANRRDLNFVVGDAGVRCVHRK